MSSKIELNCDTDLYWIYYTNSFGEDIPICPCCDKDIKEAGPCSDKCRKELEKDEFERA